MNAQDVKQIFDEDFSKLPEKEQNWLRKILVFPYEAEVPTDIENENSTKVFVVAEGVDIVTGSVCIIYDQEAEAYGRVMTLGNQYYGPIGSLNESIPDLIEPEIVDTSKPVEVPLTNEIKRKWPLTIASVVFLVVPLFILASLTFLFASGKMQEAIEEQNLEFSPFHIIMAFAVFGYPIYVSSQFLFKGKKGESVMTMLSIFVVFPIYYVFSALFTNLGIDPNQTNALVAFAIVAGLAYVFHRYLKVYCIGNPNQSR